MNMQNLMIQAQKMQKDIQAKQSKINDMTFVGTTEGFELTLNGKREIVDLKINRNIIKDQDDLDALEDMIKIAYNNASEKLQKEIDDKLGSYTKGLNGLL